MKAADELAQAPAPPDADGQPGEQPDQDGKHKFGRVLDVAGICAAVVLGVILVDIVSGGKLTRWAAARRPGPAAPPQDGPPPAPCEDC